MAHPENPVKTILVIDGGGTRAIIPSRILQDFEQANNQPVAEMFDMVACVSGGSFPGAGLVVPDPDDPARPHYSARESKNFMRQYGQKVFPPKNFKAYNALMSGSIYDPRPLERILYHNFGDLRMRDTLTSLIIGVSDIETCTPKYITHIKGQPDHSPEQWTTMHLREAVRATTAAPPYFPAAHARTWPNGVQDQKSVMQHALIDGIFAGSHLMRYAYGRQKQVSAPDADIHMLYLGTGNHKNGISLEAHNKMNALAHVSLQRGVPLLSLAFNMSAGAGIECMRMEIGDRLLVLDRTITPDSKNDRMPSPAIDDATPDNMARAERFAVDILRDNAAEITRFNATLDRRRDLDDSLRCGRVRVSVPPSFPPPSARTAALSS